MNDAERGLPWWWLRASECRVLGLGQGAQRSDGGVVFGDRCSPLRIEVLGRASDAPISIGEVSLRLWGDLAQPHARVVLAAAARLLSARRGGGGFELEDATQLLEIKADSDGAGGAAGATLALSGNPTIIDVPSVCERACTFCEVSCKPLAGRRPRGVDADVERAIVNATGAILFTGDDALSHPRIVEFVRLASANGHPVTIIGPPRLKITASLASSLAAAGLRRWHTGIFGAEAADHDAVAGLAGAFAALVEALVAFRREGIVVELLTPLVRSVLPRLDAVVARAAELSSEPLTLMPYAPDSMVGTAFDSVVGDWSAIREALDRVASARVHVDGVPLCVLPDVLRVAAGGRLERTDEQVRAIYPSEVCDGCALRARCPGVATTAYRAVGSVGLSPVAAASGRR